MSLTAVADLDPPGSPNIKVMLINLMMPSLREFVVKPEAPRATRAPHYVNHSPESVQIKRYAPKGTRFCERTLEKPFIFHVSF